VRRPLIVLAVFAVIWSFAVLFGSDTSPLNAGENSWTPTGLDTRDAVDMVASPDFANDKTLFVVDYLENTVWRTENAGESWERVSPRFAEGAAALGISPDFANDDTLFFGDARSVYKSKNRGDTWRANRATVRPADVNAIALSPTYAFDQVVFLGADKGVYKSPDGGQTWEFKGPTELTEDRRIVHSLALSPNYAMDQTVFAGFQDSGLYKSSNSGTTWDFGWLRHSYVEAIVCSQDYSRDHTLFAGTSFDGVFKSTDGAMGPWRTVEGPSVYSLAISPAYATDQTLYAGKRDGVRVTTDGGRTWVNTDGLFRYRVHSLVIASNSPRTLFAGTFKDGVFEYTVVLPTATPTITPTATSTMTPTPAETMTPTTTPTPTATTPPPQTPQVFLPLALASAPIANREE